MKVIISGGGTGGHIYPAIAIADKIKNENPNAQILFIGTAKGLESEVVPKAGYKIKTITVSYLRRKISIHNIKSAAMLMKGLFEARTIIKKFKPDIVIGTGGFVCGPVLYVASRLGVKTLIHEQNVYPGLTNKILGKYVNRIAISFDDAKKYFKDTEKIFISGNPIREDFLKVDLQKALMKYKIKKDLPLVLIVGGSGGSLSINRAAIDLVSKFNNDFQTLLVTGKAHYKSVKEKLNNNENNLNVEPYLNDMPLALKACDIIICSAGAISISEITALGKPSILIPKAYTAENHQEFNARALEDQGAAITIKEKDLNGMILNETINSLLGDKDKLKEMEKKSKRSARINAIDIIYSEIEALIKSKN